MVDTDYITKESALSCFHDWIDRYGHEHTADEMVEYQRIEDLPVADVVEVVRCKDCVHNCGEGFVGGTISCGLSNLFTVGKDPMEFCSSGERRTDDVRCL